MTSIPPLFRAAMCISLENAGVERPRVSRHGRVTECPYDLPASDRIPLTDPVFIVQAAIEADVIIERLSGQPSLVGKAILKQLGVDGAEAIYDKRRDLFHDFDPNKLAEACWLAASIIGQSRTRDNLELRYPTRAATSPPAQRAKKQ